jgi:hypothetical protein
MELQEVMLSIIGGLVAAISAWFWHDKKEAKAELKETREQIDLLKTQTSLIENRLAHYTTQAEVKEMIREYIEPLRQDQKEIKSDLKEIITLIGRMSQELAVINALKGNNNGNGSNNKS